MAILCRSIGLLFVMTPRTGCSAIGRVLRDQFDGEWLPTEDVRQGSTVVVRRKHCTLDELLRHGVLSTAEAADLLTCATVRNPFDSLVSLYRKRRSVSAEALHDPSSWFADRPDVQAEIRRCRKYDFNRWLRRRLAVPAVLGAMLMRRSSMFDRFTQGIDAVLRFERLEADFNAALERKGIDRRITIPRANPTAGRDADYRQHYSPTSRRLVQTVFRGDLARYGYAF